MTEKPQFRQDSWSSNLPEKSERPGNGRKRHSDDSPDHHSPDFSRFFIRGIREIRGSILLFCAFLRRFTENQHKRLSMNNLHQKSSLTYSGQLCLIKPDCVIFIPDAVATIHQGRDGPATFPACPVFPVPVLLIFLISIRQYVWR
jgi:hypothetical protein